MKESGKLYIDRIFFESYYPVLFSCKNKLDEHFMCVCCQNNGDGQKWLLGKVDVHTIIKMLKNEITVRDLFLKHTSSKVSINTINGEFHQHYNNDDWSNDSIYLPKADSYLDPDEGEFDEDIEYYRQEQRKKYNNSTGFKNIFQSKVQTGGTQLEINKFEYSCTYGIDIISEVLKNYKKIADITIANVELKKLGNEYNKKVNTAPSYELEISGEMQTEIHVLSSTSKAA